MTDLDRRVEAAARAFDETVGDRKAVFSAVVRAAFPELFTAPPQAWLAPWDASEMMRARGDRLMFMLSRYDPEDMWRAMRDSHLASLTPKDREKEQDG